MTNEERYDAFARRCAEIEGRFAALQAEALLRQIRIVTIAQWVCGAILAASFVGIIAIIIAAVLS